MADLTYDDLFRLWEKQDAEREEKSRKNRGALNRGNMTANYAKRALAILSGELRPDPNREERFRNGIAFANRALKREDMPLEERLKYLVAGCCELGGSSSYRHFGLSETQVNTRIALYGLKAIALSKGADPESFQDETKEDIANAYFSVYEALKDIGAPENVTDRLRLDGLAYIRLIMPSIKAREVKTSLLELEEDLIDDA